MTTRRGREQLQVVNVHFCIPNEDAPTESFGGKCSKLLQLQLNGLCRMCLRYSIGQSKCVGTNSSMIVVHAHIELVRFAFRRVFAK